MRIEQKEHQLIITRKKMGHYTIDVYVHNSNTGAGDLVATLGAARGSPVAQCIRLLERLLDLTKKVAGYN